MSETDCRELLARLHAFLDGELDGATCADIRAHLEECRPCVASADFEVEFKQLVARSCREAPPPGLLDRMRRLLD